MDEDQRRTALPGLQIRRQEYLVVDLDPILGVQCDRLRCHLRGQWKLICVALSSGKASRFPKEFVEIYGNAVIDI